MKNLMLIFSVRNKKIRIAFRFVIKRTILQADVFSISEIVREFFQNAYLGFYAIIDYAGQGYISAGLKLVRQAIFNEMKLHRLEVNILPDNTYSIKLVRKNGFRKEDYSPRYLNINGAWRDHEHWATTVEDWNERKYS